MFEFFLQINGFKSIISQAQSHCTIPRRGGSFGTPSRFRKGGIKATWGSDLPPSWGHGGDCSPINPSLLYYFQIIFKWLKSLRWGLISPALQWPPLYLVCAGKAKGLEVLRRWSDTGQCENSGPGREHKHRLKALKRTGGTNKRIWACFWGVKVLKSYLS